MKAAELFVKALENEGVQYIFGVPGEENLDLLEALRTSTIKFILTRHEQAAGFMAATYGRLTGKSGVCLSTLGPGATNLVTAAAFAQLGAMPMLMITGQKPIKKSKQGHFQIIDAVGMMRPITKMTKQIIHGNSIPFLVREAIRIAEEERPGAVHLEFPEDIAAEECDHRLIEMTTPVRPIASSEMIDLAALMIMKAKRPLLLIGAGANRKSTSEALRQFVDRTGIYFFNTQMGKGVIDERHPLYLGTAALSERDYVHCAIDRADLIINIGHDTVEKPPFFMHLNGTKVIHINFFSAQVDEVYFPTLEVLGDITASVQSLAEQIIQPAHWDLTYYQRIKHEVDAHLSDGANSNKFPLIPQRLVNDVRAIIPDDGILSLDNGMYKIWFARNYKAYGPNTLLLDNALASMGAGLPAAIAARLVYPQRKIMAICGDGGFMMNSQELETAVRLKLDLVVMILRDDGYGMIKWKQEAMKMANFGLDFNNPDFVQYAQSYGAQGHRVTKTEELQQLLKHCLNQKGVQVIDVPIDYSENVRVLNEELNAKTCLL